MVEDEPFNAIDIATAIFWQTGEDMEAAVHAYVAAKKMRLVPVAMSEPIYEVVHRYAEDAPKALSEILEATA